METGDVESGRGPGLNRAAVMRADGDWTSP